MGRKKLNLSEAKIERILLIGRGKGPCHMYATNRDYCLENILKKFDFSYIKNRLDTLPLGNKLTREDSSICWARKICHLCPANTIISKKLKMI